MIACEEVNPLLPLSTQSRHTVHYSAWLLFVHITPRFNFANPIEFRGTSIPQEVVNLLNKVGINQDHGFRADGHQWRRVCVWISNYFAGPMCARSLWRHLQLQNVENASGFICLNDSVYSSMSGRQEGSESWWETTSAPICFLQVQRRRCSSRTACCALFSVACSSRSEPGDRWGAVLNTWLTHKTTDSVTSAR